MKLTRPVLVYVPAYNVGRFIAGVLEDIPAEIWGFADVVVIDNQSTDNTVEQIQQLNAS